MAKLVGLSYGGHSVVSHKGKFYYVASKHRTWDNAINAQEAHFNVWSGAIVERVGVWECVLAPLPKDKQAEVSARLRSAGRRANPEGLYEAFHGAPPQRERHVKFAVPDRLVAIGKLVRLEYQPYGASRRKNTVFYHDAGDTGAKKLPSNMVLATDSTGKNFYLVKVDEQSPYPHFSARGILG